VQKTGLPNQSLGCAQPSDNTKTQTTMKTTNTSKTKSNDTKAGFRSTLTPSGQETDLAYSTACLHFLNTAGMQK